MRALLRRISLAVAAGALAITGLPQGMATAVPHQVTGGASAGPSSAGPGFASSPPALGATRSGGAAGATAPEDPRTASGGERGGRRPKVATVTLVTGDRVRLITRDGRTTVVPVPGAGREQVQFAVRQRGQQIEVVPSDAAPLLLAGKLDRRLFQIGDLVAAGYRDSATPRLPLIVQHAPGRQLTATPRGARAGHVLASVSATAYSVRKRDAGEFWRWLVGSSAGRPLEPTPKDGAFTAGVVKVWLDGPVRASLDQSVPQTGAPRVWDLGYTGKGVTVAVLDTGVDNDHPDLVDAVVAERDFIGAAEEANDGNGHGTHVAGIITGSGAASDGRYKGMAPDVTILDGKVLDDEGGGTESSLIAGMEWAAAQRARIVNMSISTWSASDGTDPVSLALNRLSTDTGPLFVVAAGNNGPFDGTVGSPGAADAALTVAAVDAECRTADFSARGPRVGDFALKPDIGAPGVGIVSARATGTIPEDPVGQRYARMSGTSMAAPHVAGAAALLAQLRPSWTPAQLKALLVSTAAPTPGEGAFDQGAGQVDAARALTQRVNAEQPNLSLYVRWPHQAPQAQTLTYRNTSATNVTLTLQVTAEEDAGKPAPDGLVTLDHTTLVVPARGTAQVTVTVDPGEGSPGTYYGGRITAQGKGVVIQTPLAVYLERESYDLTLRILDQNGALVDQVDEAFLAPPVVANPETGEYYELRPGEGGLVARLPKGTYTFGEVLVTSHGPVKPPSFTHLSDPLFEVTKDRTISLDARTAKRVRVTVEAPNARTEVTTFGTAELVGGYPWTTFVTVPGEQRPPLYALPTEHVADRTYLFVTFQVMAADGRTYEAVVGEQGRVPDDPTYAVRDADLYRDEPRFARPGAGLELVGRWYRLAELPGGTTIGVGWSYDAPLPGTRTHLASATFDGAGLVWSSSFDVETQGAEPWYTEFDLATTYSPGRRVRRTWGAAAFRPQGDGFLNTDGQMSLWFTPGNPSPGQGPFLVWNPAGIDGRVTLRRDGAIVAESGDPFWLEAGEQPSGRHTYVLDLTATQDVPWSRYATRVDAQWTFPLAGSADDEVTLPLLNVAAAGDFDLDGRAPAGRQFALDLLPLPVPGVGRVTSVALDVSYDDGKTWRKASVTQSPAGRWSAVVTHPDEPGGYVSLRLRARDDRGNRVQWTSVRAYGLAGDEGQVWR